MGTWDNIRTTILHTEGCYHRSRLNTKTVIVGDDWYNSPDEEESVPITDLVLPFEKVVGRPSEEWLERDFRVHSGA